MKIYNVSLAAQGVFWVDIKPNKREQYVRDVQGITDIQLRARIAAAMPREAGVRLAEVVLYLHDYREAVEWAVEPFDREVQDLAMDLLALAGPVGGRQTSDYLPVGITAYDSIVSLLRSPRDRVREKALEALSHIEALEPGQMRSLGKILPPLLLDPNAKVRGVAFDLFHRLGHRYDLVGSPYRQAYLDALAHASDRTRRQLMAETNKYVRGWNLDLWLPFLLELARDPDIFRRLKLDLLALAREVGPEHLELAGPIARSLARSNSSLTGLAIDALRGIGPAAAPTVVRVLEGANTAPAYEDFTISTLLYVLGRYGPDLRPRDRPAVVRVLKSFARGRNLEWQKIAACALGSVEQ